MKKIFLKILSVFSFMFMFMFMFNVNIIGGGQDSNNIPIAMATDNNYAYPTIVAMTSILENKSPETKIDFYIMLSGDFDHSLKDKIDSLKNKYDKCSINFIDMKDKLKELFVSRSIKTAAYYRLLLPDLLPNLDKVLYMDVDTITKYDLSDLFNINIDDYYLAGCKDIGITGILSMAKTYLKQFGKQDCIENYINSGILLFNLKKMREDKLVSKLIECASSHNFEFHDQDTLNWVCHNKINIVSNVYNNFPKYISDTNNQVIIHYAGTKPWSYYNMKYADIWWNYAKLTGLEKEIKEKFPDKSKIKKNRQSKNRSAEKQRKMEKVA